MANNNGSSSGLFGANAGGSMPNPFGQNNGSNNTSGSLFSQATSTSGAAQSGQTTSLFGNMKPSGSLFGGATGGASGAGSSSTTTGGLFAAAASKPSLGFSFGQGAGTTGGTGASPSLFGGQGTPNKTTASEASGNTQSSGLFGGSSLQTPSKPSIFAQSTTPAGPPPQGGSGSLFSGSNKTDASKPAGVLFGGNSNSESAKPPGNLFGQQTQSSLGGLFGQPASTPSQGQDKPQSPSLFGGAFKPAEASSNQSTSPFGNTGASSTPKDQSQKATPSLFGTQTQSPKPGAALFGQGASSSQPATDKESTAKTSEPAKSPLSFGAQTSGSTPTASLFSNVPSNNSKTQGSGLFAQPSAQASEAPGQKPSLFGSTQPTSSAPATSTEPKNAAGTTSSSGFSLFSNPNQAKSDGASTSAPGAATTTSSAPAQSSSASLFSSAPKATTEGDKSTSTSTAQPDKSAAANATSGTTTAASNGALGSSTTGPAPSAQSRLKNKSMDEIITRWSTDLLKYQKDFQAQAEKVAGWDRQLVDNSNAISKLYSRTYQAERDTAEVQKQLSAVESQQDELEGWLERYEREVDEMMARQLGQGDALQGPDQERERTYRTAERISDKLNDMNRNLTQMIEEINAASSSISKTSKADDPLSQIVRVLNSHLAELQKIDMGAIELKKRIAEAQRDSQRALSRGIGSHGYDAADAFGRTYWGR